MCGYVLSPSNGKALGSPQSQVSQPTRRETDLHKLAPGSPLTQNIPDRLVLTDGQVSLRSLPLVVAGDGQVRLLCNTRIVRIFEFVHDRLNKAIRLADAAAVAGMEKTAFPRFFRAAAGIGFKQFVCLCKILKAAELLLQEDKSIAEIARLVGMRRSTFNRVFLAVLGQTPVAYRKPRLRKPPSTRELLPGRP